MNFFFLKINLVDYQRGPYDTTNNDSTFYIVKGLSSFLYLSLKIIKDAYFCFKK